MACACTPEWCAPICLFCWILVLFDRVALLVLLSRCRSCCWVSLVTCSHTTLILVEASLYSLFLAGSTRQCLVLYCFCFPGKCKSNCTSLHLHTRTYNISTLCINWNEKKRSGIGARISCLFGALSCYSISKDRGTNNNFFFPFTLVHVPYNPTPPFPFPSSLLPSDPNP
jgi:hypothetical protein